VNDSEGIPDSEQIEPTVAEPLRRNSVSAEQIQDGGFAVKQFVMSHSFQHLTGVEPCAKQTICLNTTLFTCQLLK